MKKLLLILIGNGILKIIRIIFKVIILPFQLILKLLYFVVFFCISKVLMRIYIKELLRCADFRGRTSRREFWSFTLIHIILTVILTIIIFIIDDISGGGNFIRSLLFYVVVINFLALAITVRRLHDIGKSGWWFFIQVIPFIGFIWLFILLANYSNSETNIYGPNPENIKTID